MFARLGLALAGAIVGFCLVEAICRIGVKDGVRSPATLWGSALIPKDPEDLRAAGRSEKEYRYLEIDPNLGWTISPGRSEGEDVFYQADAAGMRTLPGREWTPPTDSTRRIAAFGDSFTHCDEVPFEDCWTHLVEVESGARVFNAGVPGYGTDQAFLRYRAMRDELRPDIVVLGLMIGDIKRNVNVFRTFLSGWTAWSKPRFVLSGDAIELINQPAATPSEVPDMIANGDPLLARDWWYDPAEWRHDPLSRSVAYRFARARLWRPPERPSHLVPDGEAMVVTERIVAAFSREVEDSGARFICLVIPSEPDLRYSDPVPWQSLITRLSEAGVEIIDPTMDLRALASSPGLFEPRGHYARSGNEVLARFLVSAIGMQLEKSTPADDAAAAARPGGARETDTIGLFEPTTRTFYLSHANAAGAASVIASFGPGGSVPAMGDFDGDGVDTFGVYSAARSEFLQKDDNFPGPAVNRFRFGRPDSTVKPLIGNWDGQGGDSIGLYSPANGRFLLRNENAPGGPDVQTSFGPKLATSALIPLAGNWSGGDSIDGIGLYDPATGRFWLKDDPTTGGAADYAFRFGAAGRGMLPIVGNWDGDDTDNVGLYDPATQKFFLRTANAGGPADRTFRFGPSHLTPVVGNFDGR
jgi:hypothetical protein